MLTREEIEKMPAGTDFDLLIAQFIFGCEWKQTIQVSAQQLMGWIGGKSGIYAYRKVRSGKPVKSEPIHLPGPSDSPYLPKFSTSWADAGLVVESLNAAGWGHKHQVYSAAAECPGWQWTFMRAGCIAGTEADTAPLAICRAALLTLLNHALPATPTP